MLKTQLDWIPLSTGSVRPTQGRTLAVAQVNGGSQSFNAVNTLRLLGRWMRMFTIPNQSSIPMAWKAFTSDSEVPEGSRIHTYLSEINESAMRAAELCRQMLAYSGRGRFVVSHVAYA